MQPTSMQGKAVAVGSLATLPEEDAVGEDGALGVVSVRRRM